MDLLLDIGPVAHGGFCVARHEGRVVFVRHALPGERVRAVVTEGAETDRFWRADAVDILQPSPDRVAAPCPYARPGQCGGCDWQHASLPAQRKLKAAVIEEQLRRLAGIERAVEVAPVPGDDDGLGWRTRVRFSVDDDGNIGLRRHRSHEVESIDRCLIAHPEVQRSDVLSRVWPGDVESVEVVTSTLGESLVLIDGEPRDGHVAESAAGRIWQVSGGGFWQVHPGAADVLVESVLSGLSPRAGERALDLYAGVGLFAGVLADRIGPRGSVLAIEGSRTAVVDARRNLHDLANVKIVRGRVDAVLARLEHDSADIVVLDPPRTGAKAKVVREIVRRHPRAVAYVACDPSALARDLATFGEYGYALGELHAFDLFPMTHHVECVAVLTA